MIHTKVGILCKKSSVGMYQDMLIRGIKPDVLTFNSLLSMAKDFTLVRITHESFNYLDQIITIVDITAYLLLHI
jgi:hypothetical protein